MGRSILFFLAAAALSLLAAGHRFHDSAHSMGLIRFGGGKAHHPAIFVPGEDRYTLIVTATVLPPYRGDARVVLEGLPDMQVDLYDSAPVFDLSVHRRPAFEKGVYRDLRPRDRIALWVVMQPGSTPPLSQEIAHDSGDPGCCIVPEDGPEISHTEATLSAQGPALAFYDLASGNPVLTIPVLFQEEGDSHGHN